MKYEALMQRAEAQNAAGNVSSARILFDYAQSAAPDEETRDEIRERAADLGVYQRAEPETPPAGTLYEEESDAGSD